MNLEGTNADLDWSILSLLFGLSTRPLDTVITPPQRPLPLNNQHHIVNVESSPLRPGAPRPDDLGPGAGADHYAAGEESSEDKEDMPWDEASELSDWSQAMAEELDPGSSMQWETGAPPEEGW